MAYSSPNARLVFQRLVHESLAASAFEFPEKVACLAEQRSITYSQLMESVGKVASVLAGQGLQRGDRVAIYLDNSIECVIGIFGTLWAGGVIVIVNPQTKQDKLEFIIRESEAKILVTDEHLQQQFLSVVRRETPLRFVLCSNANGIVEKGSLQIPIEDFWESVTAAPARTLPAFSIPPDLAALIYTSGSTGNPKGVMMTHQSMVFARDSIIQYLRLSSDERIINVLPLAFDYGLYQLLMTIRLGATLILERSFTYPAMIVERVMKERVTVFPGVPTVYSTLIASNRKTGLSFESVRRVTNTAASLPPDYIPSLRKLFPNALLFPMYGLTECKRVSYLEPELVDAKAGSVGKPIPGTEMFLLDPDGKPVGVGERGILHVRGPHVMAGYWKNPLTSEKMLKPGAIPGERVLCTQDWFTMDAEGFFYFKGRSDDIIKTRGEKVSPVEIENILYGIAGVKEAAVIGVPDDHLGQSIKAFIVVENGVTISEREIRKYCSTKLENFMMPQEIAFVESLPKTSTGKISKKDLR
jgi:long-chain acyl-CoA synthetase